MFHTILSFLHYHPPYLKKQKITNKKWETNLFQSLSFLFGVSKNDDAVIQVGWTIGTSWLCLLDNVKKMQESVYYRFILLINIQNVTLLLCEKRKRK